MSLLLNKIDPNNVYEVQYKEDGGWEDPKLQKLLFSPNLSRSENIGSLIPLSEDGRTLNQSFVVESIDQKVGFLYLDCASKKIRVKVGSTGAQNDVEAVFDKYPGLYPPELKEEVLEVLEDN